MKKTLYVLVCLILLTLRVDAQEPFATYENKFHGYENQILMTIKQRNFTLWITGVPAGEEAQVGGIAIKENRYLQFCEGISVARKEYSDWKMKLKTEGNGNKEKSLRIFAYGDAFFKQQIWQYENDLLLKFDLVAIQIADSTNYLLIVSSGTLRSEYANGIQSAGFKIIFSSEEEIDRFLDTISSSHIQEYIVKLNPKAEKAKQHLIEKRTQKIDNNPWLSHIEYGLQGAYQSAFNMNSISGTPNTSLSLISPLVPILEGFSAGVFGRISLKKIIIQPELWYNSSNGSSFYTFADRTRQQIQMRKEISLKTLDIPLFVGYNFINKNKWKFTVMAGPQLKIVVGSTSRYSYFHTLGNYDPRYASENKDKFQTGISGGFMLDYSRFTVSARYNYFRNMVETTFDTKTLDAMPSSTLMFTVGWKIFEPIK